jgi:large subunit ribosomal protein L24
MAARIRRDDRVIVNSGAHKGAEGKVLRILPDKDRVIIEGVNMVYRHVRPNRRNPQGGRVQREAPIHISNVQPIDPKTGKGTRVRFPVKLDGKGRVTSKQRVATSGTELSEVTRADRSGSKSEAS